MKIDDKNHIASKVLAIADEMQARGVSAELVLQDAGLTPAGVKDPDTRVSQRQILAVCSAAARLGRGVDTGFAAGRRVHITHLGMFGYAVMNQPNLRAILDFALRYRPLTAPMIGLAVAETATTFDMVFTPSFDLDEDSPEFRFILDFNIGMFSTMTSDSLGAKFSVDHVAVTAQTLPAKDCIEEVLGAPVLLGQGANRLALPIDLAQAPLVLANPVTARVAERICDELLVEIAPKSALIKRIGELLMERPGKMMSFADIARALGHSERTLRRRLTEEGTSFNAVRNGLRRELAMEYLRNTSMTNDDIAASLGFSDASNFAAAFRKWTGQPPGAFRPRL